MLIFIVEDDKDIREMESYALQSSGYETKMFDNGEDVFESAKQLNPTLILLDIMLPQKDGLSVLKQLRNDDLTSDISVIMVTAKTTELDKVKGLDMGADDYLAKPFGIMELLSRIKAVLRRAKKSEEPIKELLSCGGIILDDEKHIVTSNGENCDLTYKEYELLKLLMSNKNLVMTRAKIMDKVWGFDFEGESRTVDMHIKTLRQKIFDGGKQIITIRNVGYKIVE